METPNSSGSEKMDVEPKEGRRSTPGESPLAGPHRALDGIGRFADPDDLRALRAVSKQFNAHSRLPAAIKRCFEKRWAARSVSKRARWRLEGGDAERVALDLADADRGAVVVRVAAPRCLICARRFQARDRRR